MDRNPFEDALDACAASTQEEQRDLEL